jgi:hypothetical protein
VRIGACRLASEVGLEQRAHHVDGGAEHAACEVGVEFAGAARE